MSNYFNKKALISAVKNSATLIDLSFNEESSTIISEYGGRPLGMFPKNDSYSLLWIAPNIKENIERIDRTIGGDRYWISPERDFFYKNPDNWEGWFCPEGLDPANYEILGNDEKSCTLSSPITVMNMRTKETLRGEITRQFTIIKEPIKTGLNYCGIEFLDDCVFFKPDLKINGWSLGNIISGGPDNPGTVLVPTKADPKPLSYFRPIPDDRLTIGKNYVAYKIDVDDIYKLAIRPDDINFERAAKIGYVLNIPDSDDYGFLVKLSDDVPKSQDQCFDVARDHPESEIGVIQSYNSDSPNKPMSEYGEIELQLNLFETIDNTSHGKAKHQLFGYMGSKEDILDVVEKYLGIINPKLF
ncbi:MAG: hypothetical protein EU529_13655 [Promethearchaeota archaeon]|nr:MAG: hypothetical protein EU529_13655 [Candidatus Lokiarchaeota archaeon]